MTCSSSMNAKKQEVISPVRSIQEADPVDRQGDGAEGLFHLSF